MARNFKQPYPNRQATARYSPSWHHLPWSSKATDIAHNCGLSQVVRLERGVAYYVEAGSLNDQQWSLVAAELHDRMMESVFTALEEGENSSPTISQLRSPALICWVLAVRR